MPDASNYGAEAQASNFDEYIDWRAEHPSDDLMTELLQAEFEDETGTTRRLTRAEVLNVVNLLAAAGNETTTRLIGWTGKVLADHPDERRKLVEDRSLVPNAIEELLRFEPPSPIQARYVTQDVEHHGQEVPEGSVVAPAQRLRQPRRPQVPRRGPVRRHPQDRPPSGVRLRPAFLPRAPRWPGSRVGWRSTRCSSASPRGRSTGRTPSRPGPRRCGAGSASRWCSPEPDRTRADVGAGARDRSTSVDEENGVDVMKVVVVGASSGLGRCIAVGLGGRGARVALMARRKERLADAAGRGRPGLRWPSRAT